MTCSVHKTSGDWRISRYELVDLFLKSNHKINFPRNWKKGSTIQKTGA